MDDSTLLELRDLCCERDERELFTGLSLRARAGEIWQVTGPNGAGKTTLLRILAGLHGFYEGQVCWRLSPEEPARDMLYVGHSPGLRQELTPVENLRWICALHGQYPARWRDLLAPVGLGALSDVPLERLSAGQQRRVALARLWLAGKRVWILDEPFTAIDADGVGLIEQRLREHAARGGLVIYTSHHRVADDSRLLQLGDREATLA